MDIELIKKAAERVERVEADTATIKQTVEKQGDDLLDTRSRLDKIEIKMSRPGAFTGAPAGGGEPAPKPELFDAETGQPVLSLKAGDNIASAYRRCGFIRAEQEEEYRDLKMGDWLRAIAGQKASPLAQKALSVGTDTAGGHLVPNILMPGVLEAMVAGSSLMSAGSRVIPVEGIGAGAKTYTWAAVNTVPTPAWRAEAGNVAQSDPAFRAVVATPRSLAFYFKVSRELLADAGNLEQALPQLIGQAMAKEMDRAGLYGTGTAPEPRGIKNIAGIQSVGNGVNGASLAGAIRYGNLMSASQAILEANGPMPTAAIMAPRSLIGFGNLADTTNQPLRRPDTLSAMRMVSTSQVPVNLTVGSSSDTSDIFVGGFDRTAFVIRENVSIQRLTEAFATTGEVGFLVHSRVDFIAEHPALLAVISGVRP